MVRGGDDEEEAFPRGRPSDAGDERKRDRPGRPARAGRASDSEDAAPQQRKKPKKKGKGAAEDEKEDSDEDLPFELGLRNAPRLRHGDLAEGSHLLAAVREANEEEVTVNLPYNLVGYCNKASAAEAELQSGQLPSLSDRFQPGQLVVAVVTALMEVGKQRRQRIEVSLRPSLANAGLDAESLQPNMWLPAVVESEEEHVYQLGFGVPGLSGILRKAEAKALPRPPCIGLIVQVCVLGAAGEGGTVRCSAAGPRPLGPEPMKKELLKAGFLVSARVEKVLTRGKPDAPSKDAAHTGLVLNFCTNILGVVHWHHEGRGEESDQLVHRRQHVTARVLAVVPGPEVVVHLTLIPHLVDWAAEPEGLLALPMGTRLEAEVIDGVPRYGCRVRCRQKGGPGEAFGFCPHHKLADKDVEQDTVEIPPTGETMECRVLGYNFLDGVVVVTRRPYDLLEGTLVSVAELSPGQLITGTIQHIADYGVFVQLSEYINGLVALRHLTDVPLATVPKRFQVGGKVKCRVLHVHVDKRQLSLTCKKSLIRSAFQLTDFDQARLGMVVDGFVSSSHDYGAIVSFFGGAFGLIPAKEMEVETAPAVGMAVRCRIARVNVKRRRLGLSLDLEGGQAAEKMAASAPRTAGSGPSVGAVLASVRAVQCTESGVFALCTPRGATGEQRAYIPTLHLSDDAALAQAHYAALAKRLGVTTEEMESTGEGVSLEMPGVVLTPRFNPKRSRKMEENREQEMQYYLLVSLKASLCLAAEEGAFVANFSEVKEQQAYAGYVRDTFDGGVLVSLGGWKMVGYAQRHQIADHFVEKPSEELKVGQSVRALVTSLKEESKRFSVDLRPSHASTSDMGLLTREAEATRLFFEKRVQLVPPAEERAKAAGLLLPGTVIGATVTARKDYGVLLELDAPHEGYTSLALKENMPADCRPKKGDSVRCAVLDFDPETGIVDVSLHPELVDAASASERERKRKRNSKDAAGPPSTWKALKPGREVTVLSALQKPSYLVLWAKDPPAVFYSPPFGERSWSGARKAAVHHVPGSLSLAERLIVRCPMGGAKRARVPRIARPAEELRVGSSISMKVHGVSSHGVTCLAPGGIRGHLHATQLVEASGPLGSGGEAPLLEGGLGLKRDDILEARVLGLRQHGESKKWKIWHVELTCRPSLMSGQDASAYEAAIVKWAKLKTGKRLPVVVVGVGKGFLEVEVASGIKGRIPLLDTSSEQPRLKDLKEHFKVGQVFQACVVAASHARKQLYLTLHEGSLGEAPGTRLLARLESIYDVAGNGLCASFKLPGRRRGHVHITELFDAWAEFPLKRLKVGLLYEAVIVPELRGRQRGETEPHARIDLSLRPSLVHGKAAAEDERRPEGAADLSVGSKVTGYVVNAGPKGVFLAISRTLTGRIRLKALRDDAVLKDSVANMYRRGEIIRGATVVEVDEDRGRVELSLRKGAADGRLTVAQLSIGDTVSGRVRSVQPFGLFIRLDNSAGLDAMVHRSEISDSASVSLASYPVGTKIARAKVTKIDGQKVSVSLKPSLFQGDDDDEEDSDDEDEEMGDEEPAAAAAAAAAAAGSDDEAPPLDVVVDSEEPRRKKPRTAGAGAGEAANVAAVYQEPLANSEDEAPWEAAAAARKITDAAAADFHFPELRAAAGRGRGGAAAAGAGAGGSSDDEDEDEEADEDSDGGKKKPTRRDKKALKKVEAQELQRAETELAEGVRARDPRSVEDFERLLLTEGDTSIVWIRYMAFHLKTSELERARQVAERAVKHVGFTEAKERFNVWVAYMNLECTFGTQESAEAIFRRAVSHNEAKHVHLQLARIHQRNKQTQLAVKAYDTTCKKFPQSKKVWLGFMQFLYDEADVEGARKTLPRCLAATPRRKHPVIVSQAALMEYRQGSVERGKSIFEGLLDSYPKRTDLWGVYLDAHIKANTPPKVAEPDLAEIRALLGRCCALRLKAAKMRFFFKRALDFEKRFGDDESQERVREMARNYVEEQAA